jgi:hypothetical protein
MRAPDSAAPVRLHFRATVTQRNDGFDPRQSSCGYGQYFQSLHTYTPLMSSDAHSCLLLRLARLLAAAAALTEIT